MATATRNRFRYEKLTYRRSDNDRPRWAVYYEGSHIGTVMRERAGDEHGRWVAISCGNFVSRRETKGEAAQTLLDKAQRRKWSSGKEEGFKARCDGCGAYKMVRQVDNSHYRVCTECKAQPFWM